MSSKYGEIGIIKCLGSDSIERILYVLEDKNEMNPGDSFDAPGEVWHFNVFENPSDEDEENFQVTITPFFYGAARTPEITAHYDQRRKGIPEKVFQFIADYTGRIIFSSCPQEGQSKEAVAMWERLKKKGLAEYDLKKSRYFIKPNNS